MGLRQLGLWLLLNVLATGLAATFTVNSTGDQADANPGNGVCSTSTGTCTLRAAVQEANALVEADTINFSLAANSTITLTTGTSSSSTNNRRALTITESLAINGSGSSGLTISGGWNSVNGSTVGWGIFFLPTGANASSRTVAISDLSLRNGNPGSNTGGTSPGVPNSNGGAIFAEGGTVNISRVTFGNNHANDGSALDIETGTTLNVTNSTFSNGMARDDGGAVDISNGGTATFSNVTFANNRSQSGSSTGTGGTGGAIRVDGALNLSYVTMAYNVGGAAGGIDVQGSVNMRNSIIIGNTTPDGTATDCNGVVTDQGNNWGGAPNGCGLANTTTTAALALSSALGSNGGATQTLSLGTSSVVNGVIPTGSDCGAGVGATDQRGTARAVGAGCEPGAYELPGAAVTVAGTLFNDTDRDGVLDAGEGSFTSAATTVTLTNTSSAQVFTTTTSSGSYTFSNIPFGTYNVSASASGYFVTTAQRSVTLSANGSYTVQGVGLAQLLTPPVCSTVFAGGYGSSTSAATGPFNVYPLNTSTGQAGTTLFATPYQTVALARDPVTGRFYYIENVSGATAARIGYYNPTTGQQFEVGTINKGTDSGNFTRFGFNGVGVGYASISANNAVYQIAVTGTTTISSSRLGTISGLPTGLSGDFAITAANAAWLSANGDVYRIDLNTLAAVEIVNTTNPNVHGVAFDSSGNFFTSDFQNLYQIDLGTFTFSSARPFGGTFLSGDLASCAVPTFTPVVSAAKTVSPSGNVSPGQILSYTVTVANSGNAVATSTAFADAIPANTSYVPGSTRLNGVALADDPDGSDADTAPDMPFVNGSPIKSPAAQYSSGTLATGSANAATVTFQVQVNNPVPAGATQISNQGSVTYATGPTGGILTNDPNTPASNDATVSQLNLPDLSISKTHAGDFTRGLTGTYALSVTNVGAAASGGTVSVSDSLPTGLTPTAALGAGWACALSGQTVSCTRSDSLAAGASYPAITLSASVAQSAANSLTNTATVSGGGQTNTANDSSSDPTNVVSQADLSLLKSDGQASEIPGTPATYTLTVGNAGPSNASGATVTDTFPGSITGVTWTCTATAGSTCPASGSGNIAASVSLLVGGSATFTATGNIAASATGALVNTATVTAPSGATDPDSANNAATDTDTLTPQADLSLSKTGPASATPGSSISYTLTVTNTGPSDATNVTVNDATPTGLTFVSNSGGCTTAFPCTLGALAPGASRTITATFLVPPNYGGPNPIVNAAAVSSPTADPNSGNNAAQAATTLAGASVSGTVYHDLQPNALREPDEAWATGVPVFVNLVQGGTVVHSAQVAPGSGTYSLSGVAPGSYTLVVANSAAAATPLAPAGWLFISPDGSRSLSVGSSGVTGQDFGLFRGSRVTGAVFRDDGQGGGFANDALQNGGEVGMAGVSVSASDGSHAIQALTDASGVYTLYLPSTWTSPVTLSHPLSPATGTNIGGSSVSLAALYADPNAARRSINPLNSGGAYAGYTFGVVDASEFRPDRFAQTTSPGSVSYTHLYRPGTLGAVGLAETGGFNYQFFLDSDCDGAVADAERVPVASFSVDASWPREADGRLRACALEVRVSVPAGEAEGTIDIASVSANLAWLNNPLVSDARTVVETTTIMMEGNLRLEKRVRNVSRGGGFAGQASGSPEEVLEYCVSYRNLGAEAVSGVEVSDPLPFFTDFIAGAYGSGRDIRWTRHGDGSSVYLSAAVGDDEGELLGGVISLLGGALATVNAGEHGEVCFQAQIR